MWHTGDVSRPGSNQYKTRAGGKPAAVPAAASLLAQVQPAAPETFEGFWCSDCEQGWESDSELLALYECGSCGTVSSERRCEQCHKFMARSSEMGCPECEQPVDAQAQLVRDHDGQLVRQEDYEPEGDPAALRRKQQAAQVARQRAEKLEQKTARLLTGAQKTTWDQIRTGQQVALIRDGKPDVDEWVDEQPAVVSVMRPGPHANAFPGQVVTVIQHYGHLHTAHFDLDTPVMLLAGEPAPPVPWVTMLGNTDQMCFGSPHPIAQLHYRALGVDIVGDSGHGQGWVLAHLHGAEQIRQTADAIEQLVGPGPAANVQLEEPQNESQWHVSGHQIHPITLSIGRGEPLSSNGNKGGPVLRIDREGYTSSFSDMDQCRGLAAALRQAADQIERRLDLLPAN